MKKAEIILFLIVCVATVGLGVALLRAHRKQPTASVDKWPHIELEQSASTIIGIHPDFKGQPTASYTLVEFADYQCPACGRAESLLSELLTRYPGKLHLIFHNFPLDSIHPNAMSAAIAAEASREQGHFWPVHDALFAHQKQLDANTIKSIIMEQHLDYERFKQSCATTAKQRVKADINLGASLWLNATPTFVLCCPDKKAILLTSLEQVPSFL